MNQKAVDKLKQAIRKLVMAEIANSWRGGGCPDDIPIIEQELLAARLRVHVILARNTEKPKAEPEPKKEKGADRSAP